VTDIATHGRKLLEQTTDWFAQDNRGNVWYLGENTAAFLPGGKFDWSGSWQAGVRDGEPGIIMLAHPRVPDAYRQEFLRGSAEDTAWIVNSGGSAQGPVRRAAPHADLPGVHPARARGHRPEDLCCWHRDRQPAGGPGARRR
jgi:hypothetical protein